MRTVSFFPQWAELISILTCVSKGIILLLLQFSPFYTSQETRDKTEHTTLFDSVAKFFINYYSFSLSFFLMSSFSFSFCYLICVFFTLFIKKIKNNIYTVSSIWLQLSLLLLFFSYLYNIIRISLICFLFMCIPLPLSYSFYDRINRQVNWKFNFSYYCYISWFTPQRLIIRRIESTKWI